jgi:hypothetical protein
VLVLAGVTWVETRRTAAKPVPAGAALAESVQEGSA